jgi:hypothetical protein
MASLALVEGSCGKRLLQALVTELQLQSPRFVSMNEAGQGEVLERLRAQVDAAVREVVHEIAADKSESARVTIERGAHALVNLIQAVVEHGEVGSQALLVLCDPEQFVGDLDTVKPTPNQGDLIGDGEDD